MTYHDLSGFLQRITSFCPKLLIPWHAMIKTILTIVLIGFIWTSFSEVQAGRGGIAAEVGDVQGIESELYMNTSNVPFLKQGKQSPSTKQDEMEKARMKALDEKLRKAEEEGNRPTTEGSGTELGPPTPSNTGGAKP